MSTSSMDFETFVSLYENPRVQQVEPGQDQNPTLDKIRKAGDVGKREVLSRVTGKQVQPQNYAATARDVTADAIGTQWTDGNQPEDQEDLEFVRQQALMRFAPDYAQEKGATAAERRAGITPIENLPLADRMAKSADAIGPMGGLTGDKNVDDEMNKAVRAADSPKSRGTLDTSAGEIGDISYQRHKYQPEIELGFNISPDEVSTLVSLISDDREGTRVGTTGDYKGKTFSSPMNRAVGENPINALSAAGGEQMPSGRDIENLNPEAMEKALQDGKITEEQFERQMTVLTALANDDAPALQSALFQHEVNDEAVDQFFSVADPNKINTLAKRGLGELKDNARWRKAYGGNLPASMNKFKVKGAPDGVYDLYAMSKDPMGKRYLSQALNNRSREVVRTWLKQGGRDAYAHHEGVRSLLDMNLEHITNIAGEGNFDHPSNWVWASEELNKLKNEYNLIDRIDEFATDKTSTGLPQTYDRNTFDNMFKGMKKADQMKQRKEFKKAFPEFRGAIKIGAGGMGLSKYAEYSDQDIDEFRERVQTLGYSKKQAAQLFPYPETIIDRLGYSSDPEQYEARRQAAENKSILLQTFAERLKSSGKYKKQSDALNSPEGREFQAALDNWQGELPGDIDEIMADADTEDF